MAIYRVDNQSELNAAVQKARGGDSILLAAGRYDKLELNSSSNAMKHVKFASSVTIASADKSRPAVIEALNVNGAANLNITGLKFDHTGESGTPFRVNGSSNVSISNSIFDGHTGRDGFGVGDGLMVTRSSGVVIEDNKLFNFANGFGLFGTSNLVVSGNDISQMRNDGARLAGVTNVKILDNKFHNQDSPSSLKHKDAIQFWTSERDGPSKNVIIRGNDITNAETAHTIYMGNELARRDATKAYKDFLIEDNVIKGGHSHGIVIEHVNGAIIRDNLLDRAQGVPDRPLYTPIISIGDKSVNVIIAGNEVASVQRPANATWKIFGNKITDNKDYQHWLGHAASGGFDRSPSDLYKSWSQPTSAQAAGETRSMSLSESEGDTFWFRGGEEGAAASESVTLDGVDFDRGDALAFSGYDKGAFQAKLGGDALAPQFGGSAARIDSLADIAELADRSADVSAWVADDGDLMLRIAQDRGVETYVLTDLGDDFRLLDQPELF